MIKTKITIDATTLNHIEDKDKFLDYLEHQAKMEVLQSLLKEKDLIKTMTTVSKRGDYIVQASFEPYKEDYSKMKRELEELKEYLEIYNY